MTDQSGVGLEDMLCKAEVDRDADFSRHGVDCSGRPLWGSRSPSTCRRTAASLPPRLGTTATGATPTSTYRR